MSPFSLYIHVPFCIHKCPYCDFNTYAVPKVPEKEYCQALASELEHYSSDESFSGREIQTIYFGGGTPSLLSPLAIETIIKLAGKHFKFLAGKEVTLEANPERVSADLMKGFYDSGVNRISFGSQSLQSRVLKLLGRTHSAEDVIRAVEITRSVGLTNINLDLIFGVPAQDLVELQKDIEAFLAIDPKHISAYGLTIERGTPFYQDISRGVMTALPDEECAPMMEQLIDSFNSAGLPQYEVSNFAKPGYESKHNQSYWNRDDYLGLGAGAHSYLCSRSANRLNSAKRWSNLAKPAQYIEAVSSKGQSASWQEDLTLDDLMYEFFFLGLRRVSGVTQDEWRAAFESNPFGIYHSKLEELYNEGFLTKNAGKIALSRQGFLLADSVFERLVA